MITTGHLRRKAHGEPQKLQIVKTGSNPFEAWLNEPKPEREIIPGTKIGGKMLVIGGTDDRVMNNKRKFLMVKIKMQRQTEAEKEKVGLREPVIVVQSQPSKIEVPPEPLIVPPEKKKRGRPKKKDKKTE